MLVLVLAAVGAASAQKDFYDKEKKVGFKYPSAWKLEMPEKGKSEWMEEISHVSLPPKSYPGTNFQGGTATLSSYTFAKDESPDCPDVPFGGYAKQQVWRKVKVGGKSFDRFDDTSGHRFRTAHNGTCYEVWLQVATTRSRRAKRVDTNAVFAKLETVVRSLYF
jgi:hypothetical protein